MVNTYWFWGAIVAVLVIWLMLYLVDRFKITAESVARPTQSLFMQLCQAHALSLVEVNELKRLSELMTPGSTSSIFVRPDLVADGCEKLGVDPLRANNWLVRLFGEEVAAEIDRERSARPGATSTRERTAG
jgi:hypothetical protein